VRAALLLGVVALVPMAPLLVLRPEARAATMDVVAWALLVVAYGSVWFALCAFVNALARSSAFNAMTLVGTWVVLVLVLPLLLNLLVNQLAPAPSRIELATETRIVTIRNLNQLSDRFGTEYTHVGRPEVLRPKDGRLEVPQRMRAFFLAAQALDAGLDGLMDRFDAQLAHQQSLVDRWGVVSPAVVAHEGMASLSGNGSQRYLEFQRQVKTYHDAWKAWFAPRIVDGLAIQPEHLAQLPAWHWREVTSGETGWRLLQLAAPAARSLKTALAPAGVWIP
jgi:ABC-2 type transport system permease protein